MFIPIDRLLSRGRKKTGTGAWSNIGRSYKLPCAGAPHIFLPAILCLSPGTPRAEPVEHLIRQAGNAEDDLQRLEVLGRLANQAGWTLRCAVKPAKWRPWWIGGSTTLRCTAGSIATSAASWTAIASCNKRPDTRLLYATATGDRGNFEFFPLNAVRWLTPARDIAALVTRSGRDRLSAELFHFGDRPRTMQAEFYLLRPGSYRLTLSSTPAKAIRTAQTFVVTGPRTRISLTIPPGELCMLKILPATDPLMPSRPTGRS